MTRWRSLRPAHLAHATVALQPCPNPSTLGPGAPCFERSSGRVDHAGRPRSAAMHRAVHVEQRVLSPSASKGQASQRCDRPACGESSEAQEASASPSLSAVGPRRKSCLRIVIRQELAGTGPPTVGLEDGVRHRRTKNRPG